MKLKRLATIFLASLWTYSSGEFKDISLFLILVMLDFRELLECSEKKSLHDAVISLEK